MKICTKCKKLKDLSEFYKQAACRDGLTSACKTCRNKDTNLWLSVHPKYNSGYYLKHPEYNRDYYLRIHPLAKSHVTKPRDTSGLSWSERNPDAAREMWNRSSKKRISTPRGKLNKNMQTGIYSSLKKAKAGRHWETLAGYTVDQLKTHLEKLFKPGMTWDNYGSVWEIDHIIPKVVFNFQQPEHIDFRLCWELKNLQPLEAQANRIKRSRLAEPFQPSLLVAIQ